MSHTPGEVFLDVRVGCLAIYPAYRIGETPGCHADDDRNIHYSNKGACRDEREVWHLPQQTVDDARRIAALRTAEESSVVGLIDGTHAKQQEDSANTGGDGDSVIDDNPLQVELVRLAEKSLGEVEE